MGNSWGKENARIRLTKDLLSCFNRDNLPDPSSISEDDIGDAARTLLVRKTRRDTEFLEPFISLVEEKGKDQALQHLQESSRKDESQLPQDKTEDRVLIEDLWALSMELGSPVKICQLLGIEKEVLQDLESLKTRLDKIIMNW